MTEPRLTAREWQVVALLRRGYPTKRIADRLEPRCAPRTVEAHIERIAAKLPNPENLSARILVMLWARDAVRRDVA